MASIGSRLNKLRTDKKLTFRQLGSLAGVDAGWINRLESGERSNISLDAAIKLADAFRVSLDYLAGRDKRRYDA